MDGTPKKLLNSETTCFICSSTVNSKQRVRIFKSGSKGSSAVDLQGLINKTLDIDVTVYANSDVAICIKCYKCLLKFQKAEDRVQEIKNELKAVYSDSDKRVKRLQRTEDVSAPAVKKHLAFGNSTTCTSSSSPAPSTAFSILGVSPITKPWEGTSLIYSSFAPVVTSSPKIPGKIIHPKQSKIVVEYPSKTINKTLSGDLESLGKALAHGPPSRIAKAILKSKTLRTEVISQVLRVVSSEVNHLCSRRNPSLLRKTCKDDLLNFDMRKLCEEWKERAPVFYAFLLTCTCCSTKSTTRKWVPSIAISGSVLLKQRNNHMNATASILGILIKTGSLEVIKLAILWQL